MNTEWSFSAAQRCYITQHTRVPLCTAQSAPSKPHTNTFQAGRRVNPNTQWPADTWEASQDDGIEKGCTRTSDSPKADGGSFSQEGRLRQGRWYLGPVKRIRATPMIRKEGGLSPQLAREVRLPNCPHSSTPSNKNIRLKLVHQLQDSVVVPLSRIL